MSITEIAIKNRNEAKNFLDNLHIKHRETLVKEGALRENEKFWGCDECGCYLREFRPEEKTDQYTQDTQDTQDTQYTQYTAEKHYIIIPENGTRFFHEKIACFI